LIGQFLDLSGYPLDFLEVARFFHPPVAQLAGEIGRNGVKKIAGGQVGAGKQVFALGGAHGQHDARPGGGHGVVQAQLVTPGPEGLGAVDQGLELGRDIVEIHGRSGHDNLRPPQQGVNFPAHVVILLGAVAFFFTKGTSLAGMDMFVRHVQNLHGRALFSQGVQKSGQQIMGVAVLAGATQKTQGQHGSYLLTRIFHEFFENHFLLHYFNYLYRI